MITLKILRVRFYCKKVNVQLPNFRFHYVGKSSFSWFHLPSFLQHVIAEWFWICICTCRSPALSLFGITNYISTVCFPIISSSSLYMRCILKLINNCCSCTVKIFLKTEWKKGNWGMFLGDQSERRVKHPVAKPFFFYPCPLLSISLWYYQTGQQS